MKKSRFSDSQVIAVLKQAEGGTPVPELCRQHGISSATFYKWRCKFGGWTRRCWHSSRSCRTRTGA
jgi:putative transposase